MRMYLVCWDGQSKEMDLCARPAFSKGPPFSNSDIERNPDLPFLGLLVRLIGVRVEGVTGRDAIVAQ